MKPNGRDDGRGARARLLTESAARGPGSHRVEEHTEVVFDFKTSPGDRVWVRALPYATWALLEALGVDHLFHVYPGPEEKVD